MTTVLGLVELFVEGRNLVTQGIDKIYFFKPILRYIYDDIFIDLKLGPPFALDCF